MVFLKRLSKNDKEDVYQMLQNIDAIENSFTNPVKNMNYSEYKAWLKEQDNWCKGIDLPQGYVRQSIYWLFDEQTPVGIGKIRHELTPESRLSGGNIGYAIDSRFRGKGYGKELLRLLILKTKELGILEVVITIDKGNDSSKSVALNNGAYLFDENPDRWYFKI